MAPNAEEARQTLSLLKRMIAIDSQSFVSNLPIAELMEQELLGWVIERIDYVDAAGVAKRNLVAVPKNAHPKIAFAGHLDTVSAADWVRPPFEASIEGDRIYGLGACDMKGPIAAFITAAKSLPMASRPTIVLTADEEIGKQGVRETAARSALLREIPPACFVVCEPTGNGVVRGHRVDIQFVVKARGIQAHSSTGKGMNANLALVPFLVDLRALHFRLREDVSLHDRQYDPPFCDLNFIIDNHGTFNNTTVGEATCSIKFRYSKSFDPAWLVAAVEGAAANHGLDITTRREAPPPELSPVHPLVRKAEAILNTRAEVAGLGTEASEYSALAPTLICGPGEIANAHTPTEHIEIPQLLASVVNYKRLADELR